LYCSGFGDNDWSGVQYGQKGTVQSVDVTEQLGMVIAEPGGSAGTVVIAVAASLFGNRPYAGQTIASGLSVGFVKDTACDSWLS
jgi:hypothetical protein